MGWVGAGMRAPTPTLSPTPAFDNYLSELRAQENCFIITLLLWPQICALKLLRI